jgi:hypothetical protein
MTEISPVPSMYAESGEEIPVKGMGIKEANEEVMKIKKTDERVNQRGRHVRKWRRKGKDLREGK